MIIKYVSERSLVAFCLKWLIDEDMNLFHLFTGEYMCMHAHHSIHKVYSGKFLFPFIQWMGLLCTNSWCCKYVAVTTVRTLSVVLSMPCTEAHPVPAMPVECLRCMFVSYTIWMCLCASTGLGTVCNACWQIMASSKTMGHIQIFMNRELRFSKVLNLKVGKHLSK